MSKQFYKILSGILITVYLSSVMNLSGTVFATSAPAGDSQPPAVTHNIKRGTNPETGKVSFIGGGEPIDVPGVSSNKGLSSSERALGMANAFGREFGLKNPSQELKLLKSEKDSNGKEIGRFQQTYQGIPVIAGEMIVNMNAEGKLLSMNGEVSSELSLDTKPSIKSQDALETALEEIAAIYKTGTKDLVSTEPELWIFDESLLTASTSPAELVWRMEVTTADEIQPIRELVLVNAQTGDISWHINQIDTGADATYKPLQAVSNARIMSPLAGVSQIQYADLVVDEARGRLYGADKAGSKIDVINMSDLAVINTFLLVSGALPTGIDLSPDGSELAVAQSGLSRVMFINLIDGSMSETPAALSGNSTKVTDVVYGRSGIVYALSSNGLHIINTTLNPHAEDAGQYISGGTSSYSERFGVISSDKNTLYYVTGTCCSGDNSLFKYDVSAGLVKPVETNHTYLSGSGYRTSLHLSLINDSTLITTFGTIYNTSTLTPIAKNGQISSPGIAIPGHTFYVTSYDNTSGLDVLYFFDSKSSYKVSSILTTVGTPGAMAVTGDGSTLFVSSTAGLSKVSIGNTPPGTPISLPQSLKQYRDFVFDMQRSVVYGTDASNRLDVLDLNSGSILNSYLLPNGANPIGVDLSPDGQELAVALNGLEAILFINPLTGIEIARVTPKLDSIVYYENQPYDVLYGRAGRLYSDANPGSSGIDYLHVIDTTAHTWLARSSSSLRTGAELATTVDRKYVFANQTFSPNNIYVFDVQTDTINQLYQGPHGPVSANQFALAPDGSKIFTSGGQVWSGNVQEQLGTLEGGAGKLIKYVPGLNLMALASTGTGGDTIRFLSPVNYRLLSTYGPIPNGTISEMESAPDGSRLFLNVNSTVQVLKLDSSRPMSITVQSGSAQSVQVSTPFQDPLKVKVQNIYGNPVPNTSVTFQASLSGASGTFSDTQTGTTSVVTDTSGIATSPLFSANSIAGPHTVQATIANLGASASFQFTNLASVTCTVSVGTGSATLFLPYKQYACGKTAYGVAGGDFNTDGRRDIALATNDGLLLIFLQDVNGALPAQPRVYAGSTSSMIGVGDLNHDGRDDIVIPGGTEIRIFLQRNDGTLPYPVKYSVGSSVGALTVGDVNNDGLADIVISFASSSIGVFTQNPDGTLNSMVVYPSLYSLELAIGDVNGDGLNDVVSLSNQSSNQLQVFLQINNTLNPYFSVGLSNCSYSCSGGGIGLGDINNDGRLDIVMSYGGNRPNSYIAVFTQDGNGNLLSPTIYSSYDIPNPVEIADVNSDQRSDVITLHSGWNKAGVYLQQNTGALATESLYSIPYKSWYYALDLNIGDINNDGLPDLAIADNSGLVILYRNTTIPPTPSPIPTFTPSPTPGPTSTPGPGPSPTPRATSTPGSTPTSVPPSSTGRRNTYSAAGGSTLPGTFLCNQDRVICTNGADLDADAAHRFAADTFVFYNTHHKRNSFDDLGGTIISTVNFGIGYQNAFWDGYQMVYGDNMAADDVVGHEITHGVTQYTSNLIYYGQSGAINESFSDVWGEFIDQTNNSGNDSASVKWMMGEDSALGVIRSMSNPPDYGNPDKMSSPYFYEGSYDNGGVHINSGVNNKAAYLMVEGGSFNGRTITGIGLNKTAAIYYEAQVYHLTMGANYNDLYYALFQACQNLIGGREGITPGDCTQVDQATQAVEMVVDLPPHTSGPILYVKWDAHGANNGSSWADAYKDLQSALATALGGDEIWVAAGTYKPTVGSDRTISFVLKNAVQVYGGFAGGETLRTERDPVHNVTILSGDIGVANTTSDNSYHVVLGNNLLGTVLDGFSIGQGNASGADTYNSGGGIYMNNANAILENLVISNNSASQGGGGIFSNNSNPQMTNITINDNSAVWGGGIANAISSPSLVNITVKNNAAEYGAGMGNENNSSPNLVNVTFSGNVASYGGAMINRTNSRPVLTNVTLNNNSATIAGGGGGVANDSNSTIVKNSIFWDNSGGEIVNVNGGIADITYSIIQGGYPGTGNLNLDPQLGPLTNNGGSTQTMALLVGSPAINAGTNTGCPTTDQRGVSRADSHCDIGAFEYSQDDFDSPVVIPGQPYQHTVDVSGATQHADDPTVSVSCDGEMLAKGRASVWYKYIPSASANVSLDTLGSNYDTYLAVWTGTRNNLSLVGCDNNTATNSQSQLSLFLTAGTPYFIEVAEPTTGAAATIRSLTLHATTFADVPGNHVFWRYIEGFYNRRITTGCGANPFSYCPDAPVNRAAMAVFILRAKYGASHVPDPIQTNIFSDLPIAGQEWMQPWIEEFYEEGVTTGCGVSPRIYCPQSTVTREAMAVFLLRAKYGAGYTPPPASNPPLFADVPVAGKEWMQPWIEEFYRQGYTTGCGASPLIYCPEATVNRAAMAVFISRVFNIPQVP